MNKITKGTHATRVRLHVDTPFCRVEVEGLQGTFPAEALELVDPFITTVLTSTRKL